MDGSTRLQITNIWVKLREPWEANPTIRAYVRMELWGCIVLDALKLVLTRGGRVRLAWNDSRDRHGNWHPAAYTRDAETRFALEWAALRAYGDALNERANRPGHCAAPRRESGVRDAV